MNDAFIAVDGVRHRYRIDGPDGAPVLVLSNSLGAALEMWTRQLSTLTRSLRVLRYDTCGHGQSAVVDGPCSIDRLGRDVVGLLDALDIERAHFCGLSMGGMIGMWLGIHAPQRLSRLALCNTSARIGTAERWNARIAAVKDGGTASIVETLMGVWFTPGFVARDPDAVAAIRGQVERTSREGYVAACVAVRDADLRDAIGAIRAPTLVIAGTHDGSTPPAEGRFLVERIAGARYVELDAAHISNVEAAEGFNAAIGEFFRS